MAQDSLKLINYKDAKLISKCSIKELAQFITNNFDAIVNKIPNFSFKDTNKISEEIQRNNDREGEDFVKSLKEELIWNYCLDENHIYLDYFGCAAEVFSQEDYDDGETNNDLTGNPEGNDAEVNFNVISEELSYKILNNLKQNISKLTHMGKEDVIRVEEAINYCKLNPDFKLVYYYDF